MIFVEGELNKMAAQEFAPPPKHSL